MGEDVLPETSLIREVCSQRTVETGHGDGGHACGNFTARRGTSGWRSPSLCPQSQNAMGSLRSVAVVPCPQDRPSESLQLFSRVSQTLLAEARCALST